MKLIQILLVASVGFINSNCNKEWLEEKSNKNQAIPTNLKDFQSLLDYITRMNSNVLPFGEVAADGHYVTEAAWSSATSNSAKNAYSWSRKFPYISLQSWANTYNRIFYSNIVLDGLPKINPSNPVERSDWNHIKGQALFNRAAAFWQIAQLYSQLYDENSIGEGQGIPMRFNSDITESSKRYSVKETYTQILNDIEEALLLLPPIALQPTRASKAAAYGLLARTYLSMRKYENAGKYADSCLQLSNSLLNYNSIPSSASNLSGGVAFNKEIIFFDAMSTTELSGFISTNYLVDQSLYNQYVTNDLRRTRFFNVSGTKITFKGNYNTNSSAIFCGLATDEMYLIRAECFARDSNKVSALNDLETLLKMRWNALQPYEPVDAANSFEALSKILLERRKELILRNLRWSDLRRLNKENPFKVTLIRTIGGNTYTLEPNTFKYTFPLPDDIIEISGMPQTTGW